ncbi:MAG: hypothetical protein FWE22_02955 [Firmicutes bacterium]|nr:hypothetical protein [Bacillota bacterium]
MPRAKTKKIENIETDEKTISADNPEISQDCLPVSECVEPDNHTGADNDYIDDHIGAVSDCSQNHTENEKPPTTNHQSQTTIHKRLPIFDNFRGLVIFLTIILNFLRIYQHMMPDFLMHASRYVNAVYVMDIGVVAFVSVLSFLFSYNFRRKAEKQKLGEVYRFYILKSFVFIGFGFTYRFFETNFIGGLADGVHTTHFNVFVTYGFMTLFSLIFIQLKPYLRLIAGTVLIAVHQFVFLGIEATRQSILVNPEGGIVGILAWIGLCLIASAIGDYYFEKTKRKFYIATGVVMLTGLIYLILNLSISGAYMAIFLNKYYMTAGFIFISLAITLGFFIVFDKIKFLREKDIPLIAAIGKSALVFFVIGSLFHTIVQAIFGGSLWGERASLALAGATIVLITVTLGIAYIFQRFKIKIVL